MEEIYQIIEENKDKLYNKELCSKCGGKCCKITPCSYFPKDIVLTKENIIKMLDEGKTSIKVKISGYSEGKVRHTIPVPIVGVKGRKKNAIDLLSESNRCSALTSTGCDLIDRPSGAKVLIPQEGGYNIGTSNGCYNLFRNKQNLVLIEWMKHYKVLVEVIEEYSGKSFQELYAKDLIKCALTVVYQSEMMSDYNLASLYPILKHMGLLDLVSKKKSGTFEKPDKRIVNHLVPDEKSFQKILNMNC